MRLSSRVIRIVAAAAILAVPVAVTVALMPGAAGARPTARAGVPSPASPAKHRHHRAAHRRTAGSTKGGVGIFTERCGLAKTANIDPILMPGMTDMSMAHDFFGNTGVTADSTAATLTGGSTSCGTAADSSAYWAPVLYQNGVALPPKDTLIYWRGRGSAAAQVQTMPAGISMIAGNESATAPQGVHRVAWSCTFARPRAVGTVSQKLHSSTPHDCGPGQRIRLTVTFPSCWDGHSLDGADQHNVTFPGARDLCPAGYPVRIPQLVFHVAYPTSSATGLTLSTGMGTRGSVDTAHVDFINAFAPVPLAADVHKCINLVVRCGRVTGPSASTSTH